MRLTFCGAAGTVTGSCYLVETEQVRFLVDCGMFQGTKEIRDLNQHAFLFNPGALDFILLTHAHVDHAGLIPKLWKLGYKKPVYATKATVALSQIVLPDSGHIQEMEAEWRNRKHSRTGEPMQEPLYDADDAVQSLKLFRPQNYNQEFEPAPGIKVRFRDAGHILGSALIELYITESGSTTKLVFSGDLGQKGQPIIADPTIIQSADYIVIESTYGNRFHEDQAQKVELLKNLIKESIHSGGNLVIPAFAIGRTQDLLYHLRELFNQGALPRIPVYIDSPMAISVTEIYRDNPDCYDEDTLRLFAMHQSPFEFPNLSFIRTAEESKRLNETAKGAIIIAASGMCEAGRILHHLKHNLWRPEAHILFVGYQAEGTLGRRLLEGAKVVKIMGEAINVQANVHSIGGFSAHADQHGLLEWLSGFSTKPRNLFIVHGENSAQQELAGLVKQKFEWEPIIPRLGERFNLETNALLEQALSQSAAAGYALDRKITDLEHLVLALHRQINMTSFERNDALTGHDTTGSQIEEIRKNLTELEKLINKSA
ncbi:MAG TPA: MBL fold metallo-hydrolase [Bacillota bacterium]